MEEILNIITPKSIFNLVITLFFLGRFIKVSNKKEIISNEANNFKIKFKEINFHNKNNSLEYKIKGFFKINVFVGILLFIFASYYKISEGTFIEIDHLSLLMTYTIFVVYSLEIGKNRKIIYFSKNKIMMLDEIIERKPSIPKKNFIKINKKENMNFEILINNKLIATAKMNEKQFENYLELKRK